MYLSPLPIKPTSLKYVYGRKRTKILPVYILKKEWKNKILEKEVKFALRPEVFRFLFLSMKANLISINHGFVLETPMCNEFSLDRLQ